MSLNGKLYFYNKHEQKYHLNENIYFDIHRNFIIHYIMKQK